MKEGWEMRQWKDVLEIRSGRSQKQVEDPNGKYPILGSSGKVMGLANSYICEEGTTIIGRKGTINSPMMIESKFWNVDTAFGLHALNELDKKYLFYFCLGFDFTKMDRGSGRPSLVKSDLLKIPIPIPPLSEQKAIVRLLDRAFAAIEQAQANLEKNIANAEELFQSKLNAIFSQRGEGSADGADRWEERTLGEVCELISGQHINSKDYNTEGKGIGYLTGPSDYGELHPLVSKWTEFPKRTAQKGDILITVKGSGVGSINLMDKEELCISRQIIAVRPQGIEKFYLYYFLSIMYNHFQSVANGAAIPGISREDISELNVFVPEKEIQIDLVAIIETQRKRKEHLIKKYKRKLHALNDLKKSLLQKAFAGELTEKEIPA